jgi:hypothetical protein
VKTDTSGKKTLVSDLGEWPAVYETRLNHQGGMCTWDNDVFEMLTYKRTSGCDFNGVDKKDRSSKRVNDAYDCKMFCHSNKNCNFVSFKNGNCEATRTCNKLYDFDEGYKMFQKADVSAPTTWIDNRFNDVRGRDCRKDCIKHHKAWYGDGGCDFDMCKMCNEYYSIVNGVEVFDKGDCNSANSAVGEAEVEVGQYHGDPVLKNEPLERKRAIDGLWNGYGKYWVRKAPPSDNDCSGGQWVQTTLTGYLNFDWQRHDGFQACGGVHPIKYQKDGSRDKVQFCCPDFPYTKKAKKCDRNDKNLGCTKHAKEWKGDGICDLEDCGNCPAMWDKNKFDGGDCGYVEYESAVGQAEASAYAGVFDVQQKTHSDTRSHFIYGFAVLGFGVVAYGAGRHYFGKVVEGSLYPTA